MLKASTINSTRNAYTPVIKIEQCTLYLYHSFRSAFYLYRKHCQIQNNKAHPNITTTTRSKDGAEGIISSNFRQLAGPSDIDAIGHEQSDRESQK